MENTFIEMPQSIPKLKSLKCRLIALSLELFLTYGIYFIGALSWYVYDYFIAFLTLLLSFIVIGIIRSQIRAIGVPKLQREYQYSDKEIAILFTWVLKICYNSIKSLD